jgi:hypothetical protein
MLVYRSATRTLDVADALTDLEMRAATLDESLPSVLDDARSLLIDAGQLEAAVIDAECDERDDVTPVVATFDALVRGIAGLFANAWAGKHLWPESIDATVARLAAIRSLPIANRVEAGVPEGFAFYGLFPETYLDAAADLTRSRALQEVVVIGIRSIGTTLSATVGASLAAQGIAVDRLTVRPRGHPFDRELRVSDRLTNKLKMLASRPATSFAVVDEGPGLSGSSFGAVAECLTRLGVADERIVLLPSWSPPPDALANASARRLWPRYRKFVGDFDAAWVGTGRLARAFSATTLRDVSAGRWRDLVYRSSAEHPATQPQHERRKFLASRSDGERMLIKFEGLDSGAQCRRARADRLAGAGFAPPVAGFSHGFLATRWVAGAPLACGDVQPDDLRAIARYVAWNFRRERTGRRADPAPLLEMLRVNADEGLGTGWGDEAVRRTTPAARSVARAPAVRVDGRMLPHEWLRTRYGLIKTDAASHHDDHFYPGEHDGAWDLAGAAIELDLDAAASRLLVREYARLSRDQAVDSRLPFMRSAYAAFRLGYAAMAAGALGETPDGTGMRVAAARYASVLRRELSADEPGDQSCATGT